MPPLNLGCIVSYIQYKKYNAKKSLSKAKLKKNDTFLKIFFENYNHHRSTEPLPKNFLFNHIFIFNTFFMNNSG